MNKLQRFAAKLFGMSFNVEGGKYLSRDTSTNRGRSGEDNRSNERGNRFQNYNSATNELWRRYMSQARYGCGSAHAVISFLTGEIAGNGAVLSSGNAQTQKFLDAYTAWNKLDSIGLFNAIRIGVIEGKCLRLPRVIADNDPLSEYGGVKVYTRSIRYTASDYKVICDPASGEHEQIVFSSNIQAAPIVKGQFVLTQIDGFEDDPNNTPSPASKCLQYFEAIDHVASDLRLYNKTFPAVTPVFEVQDVEAAAWLHGKLFQTTTDQEGNTYYRARWEIGDAVIVPGGTAKILEPAGNAVTSLVQELMVNFRLVSGITGIPVIFLGPVDLPSNRATAQEQPEMINAATLISRESWEASLVKEIKIAAEMLSEATLIAIPTDDIQVRIPFTNMSWLSLISTFWSNLGLAEVVSKETIREMIPVIDPAKEKKRFDAEKEDNLARAQEMASTMRLDSQEQDMEEADDGA